jgi:hypothetical protein
MSGVTFHSGLGSAAWYGAPIVRFLDTAPEEVLGHLAGKSPFAVTPAQRRRTLSGAAGA